jgi:hypothetical protein
MLAAIFFCAFGSLGLQVRGLIGTHGISPAGDFLAAVHRNLGAAAYWRVPTFCWLNASDSFLSGLCIAGCLISLVMLCGVSPGGCALALWALWLSLVWVGSPFLNFQWDALLLETAFLAVFLLPFSPRPRWQPRSPVPRAARWLLLWLLFRLMFESGIVKLRSGDTTWRDFSALNFHFETQPLPLWTAWYAHFAPHSLLWAATLAMFVIELAVPFLIFAPPRFRHPAAGAMIALQVLILATGNYAYFNVLTIALCVLLFEDAAWPRRWMEKLIPPARAEPVTERDWPLKAFAPIAAAVVIFTTLPLLAVVGLPGRDTIRAIESVAEPLRTFNGYGLFAVMTTSRPEIVIEGSNDGFAWREYEFPWKPGDIRARPLLVAPHQPRLDWQMWFAALGTVRQNPWFPMFIRRLLEGSPDVLALMKTNPFPDRPPRYIRAVVYDYHFAKPGSGGAWWTRELKGLYMAPTRLNTGETPPETEEQ